MMHHRCCVYREREHVAVERRRASAD
jgi:hypothetical protein